MTTSTTNEKTRKPKPYYNLYKPLKKADSGAAIQFSYDASKGAIFIEAAQQKGERLEIGSKDQFNWEGKIVMKLGVTDIGSLMLLFNSRKNEVKLLHSAQDKSHTSVLELNKQTGDYDNYRLQLARTEAGKTTRVQMFVDHNEMAILAHFMRESLTRMLGFDV